VNELGPRTQDALHSELATPRGQSLWQRVDELDEMGLHYGFDSEPISIRVWLVLYESPKRIVKQDWLLLRDGKRIWISTVWMGLDHNPFSRFKDDGALHAYFKDDVLEAIDTRPFVFETMSFEQAKPGFFDIFARAGEDRGQWRHAAWEEALSEHELLCISTLSEEGDEDGA